MVKKANAHCGKDLTAQHEVRVAPDAKAVPAREAAVMDEEAEEAAKASRRAEEAEQRKLIVCRACDLRVHRGGKDRHVCACRMWRVCPPCFKNSEGKTMVSAHSEVCSGALNETYQTRCMFRCAHICR